MEPLIVEPNREPTATFLSPTVGYREGNAAQTSPFGFNRQDRHAYYQQTHLQEIEFEIARLIVDQFVDVTQGRSNAKRRALRLQSRHQLFPKVFQFVQQYVDRKVDFRGENKCELGLEKYVTRMVERLRDAIMPDDDAGEPPLLPVLNRYKPVGTTAEVNFKTTRPCYPAQKSHIDQVVTDNSTWESSGAFRLELSPAVKCYARNDHLDLTIPYEYQGVDHAYEPDFLARLQNDLTVVLEIKGEEDEQDRAKHTAARRWVEAVNQWGELGKWRFHVCRDPQMLERELIGIVSDQGG
jgi:type III restriction enzyme